MYSFKEIVARLVVVSSVVMIVETRARYIYQPGPFLECMKMEIPCGGHSEKSCNEYCESNGFTLGSCSGHCCLCIARPRGMLPFVPILKEQQHSARWNLFSTTHKTPAETETTTASPISGLSDLDFELPKLEEIDNTATKPKRFADLNGIELISDDAIQTNDIVESNDIRHSTILSNDKHSQTESVGTTETTIAQALFNESEICLTPECVKTANSILENMNESVSPCDDFYEFVCGNFQKDEPIPDHKSAVTLMGSLTDKLTEQLRKMLDDESRTDLPYSSRLAKTLYDSCRNSSLIENIGLSPLNDTIKVLGGWPVLDGADWNATNWSWENTVGNLRKAGLATDYLLKVSVGPDLKNPSRRILNVAEPILALSKEQLHNPIFMEAYRDYQVDLATLLGAERAHAEEEMASVLQFERTLANMSLPRELSRAHPLNFYHPMNISDLQGIFPSVDWLSYINELLPTNVTVDSSQIINVNVPEQLTVLLNLINKTDTRVLANYLLWRTSSSVLPYLNEAAMQIQHKFLASFTGRTERKPRWRECVDVVSTTLGQAVGAMYVRQHFDETSKDVAMEMVNDIRDAFVNILLTMDWMDEETKTRAFEKLNSMNTNIGYPPELLDDKNLQKLYDGLELSADNFFGNLLNLTKGATNFGMKKLNEAVVKNDWIQFGKPAMVNAFYSPMTNSIQFPAGILQGHFFDKSRPSFMNYGSIGWVIGHEITHGYDDQGSHFDPNGELRDWWNPRTKHFFHEKAKCLVQQYGSFTYTDLVRNVTIPLNGAISVGENIADNGGIKQAYKGYQTWIQRNGPEKKLPGLKYTPNQLFWISAANNWCSKVRPQQMIESIQMGVHSPGPYRVRGTFANIEQFSHDFSCPLGTPMNPPNKCHVW